jgi:hypothetical protein
MGEITYRVRIKGIKEGFEREQVVAALAILFERPEAEVTKLFLLKKVVIKNGMDLTGAQQYLLALEQRGCACLIEPDKVKPAEVPAPVAESPPETKPADGKPQEVREATNPATATDPMSESQATTVFIAPPLRQVTPAAEAEAVAADKPADKPVTPAELSIVFDEPAAHKRAAAEPAPTTRDEPAAAKKSLALQSDAPPAKPVPPLPPRKPTAEAEPAKKSAAIVNDPLLVAAFELIRQAAESGDATAQYDLAISYRDGVGVDPDTNEAIVWARKAAARGHQGARTLVRELQTLNR